MIEMKACSWPGVPKPITVVFKSFLRWWTCSLANNGLDSTQPSVSHISNEILTWCWCPGTSAVMNWERLYSLNAGSIPVCNESSSDTIFRTSNKCVMSYVSPRQHLRNARYHWGHHWSRLEAIAAEISMPLGYGPLCPWSIKRSWLLWPAGVLLAIKVE